MYQNGPFTRGDDDDPNDFRWIVDIEGQEFHDQHLTLISDVLTKSFSMNNGLFYTAVRSSVRIKRGAVVGATPTDVALKVAANIYFENGASEAILTYGGPESLSLRKEADTSYKIEVFNDRVHHPPGDDRGDFRFYYDAFDVPQDQRFDLIGVDHDGHDGEPDTRAHPCGPIGASKTAPSS
jgi:hypothetical protein